MTFTTTTAAVEGTLTNQMQYLYQINQSQAELISER